MLTPVVMNLLLPLIHLTAPLDVEWLRPWGLMPAGNGRVIDQMLYSVRKYLDVSAIFFGSHGAAAVAEAAGLPHMYVPIMTTFAAALLGCRDQWAGGPAVLALGDAVIDADLAGLAAGDADVVCFVHHADPGETGPALDARDGWIVAGSGTWRASGLWWFRDGARRPGRTN